MKPIKRETETWLVLNTSHLEHDTAVSADHRDLPRLCSIPYGYAGELVCEDDSPAGLYPRSYLDLCEWVRRHHPDVCRVRFDRDGPVMDGLPTYDW